MSKSYVCLACRARSSLLNGIRFDKRQLRTISTPAQGNASTRPEDDISSILGRSRRAPAAGSETRGPHLNGHVNGQSSSQEDAPTRVGRYSRKELKPEELLDRLGGPRGFTNQAAVRSSGRHKSNDYPASSRTTRNDITSPRSRTQQHQRRPDQLPQELQRALQKFISLSHIHESELEAWRSLQELQVLCSNQPYNPQALWKQTNFNAGLSYLLWKSSARWLESLKSDSHDDLYPGPSEILEVSQALGLGVEGRRLSALWNIAEGIFEHQAKGSFASVQKEHDSVEELMKIWYQGMSAGLLSQTSKQSRKGAPNRHGITAGTAVGEFDWGFLPTIEQLKLQATEQQTVAELGDMMGLLLPTMPPTSNSSESTRPRAEVASSALLTLDILRSTASESGSRAKHQRFITLLEGILMIVAPPTAPALINKIETTRDRELLQSYRNAYSRLGLDTAVIPVEPTVQRVTPEMPLRNSMDKLSKDERRALIDSFFRRIGRAMERQDLSLVEKVRREVTAFAGSQGNGPTVISLELYEYLMVAFFSLRKLQTAMEIWNEINSSGYKPTVRTYTKMMQGAIGSRDLSGMQTFWTKMQQASISPDDHAWSVRIFGLIKMKHVRAGLQALYDMGNEWIAAARREAGLRSMGSRKPPGVVREASVDELVKRYSGPVNGAAKPTVVILNSAISALVLTADHEIPKALSWGRLFGLAPNLTTYNALLNVAMRHSAPQEALSILHRMQEEGIEADSTTWTVLLTAMLQGGYLDGLSAVEQQEKILELLDELNDKSLNSAGVDVQGYALIIDRLLKRHDNPPAAGAVLKHMIDSGQKPTVHIYTILMTSYFQKQPQPDFAAIESLWQRITSENNGYGANLDSIFFDRMIEGYARYHHIVGARPMLGFLERMTQEGKLPSWMALEQVARVLAERGQWEKLRSIVNDVRGRLQKTRGAFHHTGQLDFWNFVLSTGLLKDEGITRAEHLLPGEPRSSPLAAPST